MSIAKNIAWYSVYSYLLMPVTVGANIILRKWIDPYHFGLINILAILATYSLYANLGVLSYAEIKLPYLKGANDTLAYEQTKFYAYRASVAGGIVFSVLTLAVFAVQSSETARDLKDALLGYSLYFVCYQITSYHITIHRTNNSFIFLAKFQFISSVLTNTSMVVAAYAAGFRGYVATVTFAMVAQAAYLTARAPAVAACRLDAAVVLGLVQKSWKILYLGGISVLLRSADSLAVGLLLGATRLGHYSLAPIGTTMVFTLTNSVGNVLFPRLQMELSGNDVRAVFDRYITQPLVFAALILPLGIGFAYYLIPPILAYVAPAFLPGVNAFKILVWGAYFFAQVNIVSAYMVSNDRQMALSKIYLFSVFCVFVLSYLVARAGADITGIAVATSIGYLVLFCFVFFLSLPEWVDTKKIHRISLIVFLSPITCILNIWCVDLLFRFLGDFPSLFNLPRLVFYLAICSGEILILNSRIGLGVKVKKWFLVEKNGPVLR